MNFTNITDYQLINLAYSAIIEKWVKEKGRKERLNAQGSMSPIADHKIAKYEAQMEELRNWMLNNSPV